MARHFSFLSLESTLENKEDIFIASFMEDVKPSVVGDLVLTTSRHSLVTMVVNPKKQIQNASSV